MAEVDSWLDVWMAPLKNKVLASLMPVVHLSRLNALLVTAPVSPAPLHTVKLTGADR